MNSIHFANRYNSEQLRVILDFLDDRCAVVGGTVTGDYLDYLRGEIKQAQGIVHQRDMVCGTSREK